MKSNLENLKGISLSEDSNDLLSEVNDCLVKNNFRMGDFIFGYGYGVNGIIYSIGGIYPNAILFNSSPYTNIYQKNLRYSEIQEKERLFVIIDNNYISRMESFLEVLESVDLKFDNSNLIQLVKHSSGTTYNIYLISKNQKN